MNEPSALFELAAGISRAHAMVLAQQPRRTLSGWRNAIDFLEVRGLANCAMSVYRNPSIKDPTVRIQVRTIADLERAFAGEGVTLRVSYSKGDMTHGDVTFGPYRLVACEAGITRPEGECVL